MADLGDKTASLRWSVYWLLIALSAGSMTGRILAVNSVDKIELETYRVNTALKAERENLIKQGLSGDELDRQVQAQRRELEKQFRLQRPFLSANDRSRWCLIRALVEHGTYAIDDVIQEPNWDTIDMVKHDDASGVPRLYSSKPPLWPTLLAGEYWLIHKLTGATLGTHPYEIGRFMLVTTNVAGLVLAFWLLARMAERFGQTDWGRIFVMAAATFGTFLTTFAVVLNNHVMAFVSVTAALYAATRIWYDGRREARYFVVAGLFAALAFSDEMPAASFLAAMTAALLWRFPRQTLLAFVPAALVVLAGYFGTNYIAHNSLRPPYMHRSKTDPADDWYRYTYQRGNEVKVSHWTNPKGIDEGEKSQAAYVFHVLVGHHGIFSLTPMWLLAVAGAWRLWRDRDGQLQALAALIAALSLVCLAFYLARPLEDRNYGGKASAFRWVFWLAPLWLTAMQGTADRLASSRAGRIVGCVLLALSALSAAYPTWNPWTFPWLMNFTEYMGWTAL